MLKLADWPLFSTNENTCVQLPVIGVVPYANGRTVNVYVCGSVCPGLGALFIENGGQ